MTSLRSINCGRFHGNDLVVFKPRLIDLSAKVFSNYSNCKNNINCVIMSYEMSYHPSQHKNMWGVQTYSNLGSYPATMPVIGGNVYGASTRPIHEMQPPKAESISGFGQLTWLSAKAGLITCKNEMVISFQMKDFCDQMLVDLTTVLREGFTLGFQASLNETNEYTATMVQPLYGQDADAVFTETTEVDLEKARPLQANAKDAYDLNSEAMAIPALLAIFQRHGAPKVQLSSLHSQMSNCGNDELFRYVGTSSLKRRQFVERRTHVFVLGNDDSVQLQSPAVYLCVLRLASYLLRRGGATAIQSLYEYYTGPEMAVDIREWIGEGRQDFLNLISAHQWIFSLFPNRTYVSVRRNLPHFDYPSFIKKVFPQMCISDNSRPPSTTNMMIPMGGGNNHGGVPRSITRSMSAHQPLGGGMLNHPNTYTPDRPLTLYQGGALENMAHNVSMIPPLQSAPARDQWSPLSSPWNRGELHSSSVGSQGIIGSQPPPKLSKSVAVQTDSIRSDSGVCTCGCTCGARDTSRGSGRSTSPPSLESGSPLSGERISPGSGPAPIGDRAEPQPIKYYDPFGTDQLLSGLATFHLGN